MRLILSHLLVALVAYGVFTYRSYYLQSRIVQSEGLNVLKGWTECYTDIEQTQWKRPIHSRLYGYFIGKSTDKLEPSKYHFEAADIYLSLRKDYESYFTVEILNQDFDRLWTYLRLIHSNPSIDPKILIKGWDYKDEPYVSITFFQEFDKSWYIWVKGYTPKGFKKDIGSRNLL